MIVDARQINGIIECKYETHLECGNCGSEVDAIEYTAGTCSDCGQPWDEIRHVAIHVTSVPATGQTL